MFTTEHFIWLGICAALIAGLILLSRILRFSFRTGSLVMAGVALASEISKILSKMTYVDGESAVEGMVIDPGALPLHLCSLLIFAFFYLPFAKNERIKGFLCSLVVPVGLIGSLLALLMATSGTDFTTTYAYQCFIYHAVMVWYAVFLIMGRHVDLGLRAWLRNMAVLGGMAICMVWINGALQVYDTNFWYVVRPPVEDLPILNLDNGWYAYFGILLLCGLVGLSAIHLPFVIRERREKRKS